MNATVYGLVDPMTQELRYVGVAKHAKYRLTGHMSPSQLAKKTWKSNWIRSLGGGRPDLLEIEEIPVGESRDAEMFWIAYFRSIGCRLTNLTAGGDGCLDPSPESREKKRAANNSRYLDPLERRKTALSGRRRYTDPSERERTRTLTKAARSTPTSRAKTVAQLNRRWASPEQHRKQSERITAWWANRKMTGDHNGR